MRHQAAETTVAECERLIATTAGVSRSLEKEGIEIAVFQIGRTYRVALLDHKSNDALLLSLEQLTTPAGCEIADGWQLRHT